MTPQQHPPRLASCSISPYFSAYLAAAVPHATRPGKPFATTCARLVFTILLGIVAHADGLELREFTIEGSRFHTFEYEDGAQDPACVVTGPKVVFRLASDSCSPPTIWLYQSDEPDSLPDINPDSQAIPQIWGDCNNPFDKHPLKANVDLAADLATDTADWFPFHPGIENSLIFRLPARQYVIAVLEPSPGSPVIIPSEQVKVVELSSVQGIDVSSHQGDIDWRRVHEEGKKQFAYIRCTIGGPNDLDTNWERNTREALANNLVIGAYHAAYAGNNPNPIVEADWFLKNARPYIGNGFLAPALNLDDNVGGVLCREDGSPGDPLHLPTRLRAGMVEWIHAWLQHVACETGVKPSVYAYPDICRQLLAAGARGVLTDYPLWIARYHDADTGDSHRPELSRYAVKADMLGPWTSWVFHQYAENGRCDGIGANVDLDVHFAIGTDSVDLTAPTRFPVFGWPQFTPFNFTASNRRGLTVAYDRILANIKDTAGYRVRITGVDERSAQGGWLGMTPAGISYTAPPGLVGPDSFEIRFENCRGAAGTGRVSVQVVAGDVPDDDYQTRIRALAPDGTTLAVTVVGAPRQGYVVETSSDLVKWREVEFIAADGEGRGIYRSPITQRVEFHRIKSVP